MADMSDLYAQAERHQEERRVMHQEATMQYEEGSSKHNIGTKAIARYMLYRGIIETLILVVLIWSMF